ncbi:unnamed protein product [Rotaria socialis]|uniref:Uncharacterized protein n=1 Tax=Rotaria socialis TaxID=392032 RepID=A0A821H5Q7_9BILA|nr:unnamed protein product [Rotaria socialis]
MSSYPTEYLRNSEDKQSPCGDHRSTDCSGKHGKSVNAGIASSFTSDPSYRGSLAPSKLDAIHQTNSCKQAKQLERTKE